MRIDIVDHDNTIGILELEEMAKERFHLKDIEIAPSFSGTCHDVAYAAARMVDSCLLYTSGLQMDFI